MNWEIGKDALHGTFRQNALAVPALLEQVYEGLVMGWETELGLANCIPTDILSDQRRSTRFEYDMRMVTCPANNRTRVIPGRIIDVSCGGVRAVIGAELQVGEVHELEFGLRDTSAVVR